MVVELGLHMWFIVKRWRSLDSIASQHLFDLTAMHYGICNLAIMVIFSINLNSKGRKTNHKIWYPLSEGYRWHAWLWRESSIMQVFLIAMKIQKLQVLARKLENPGHQIAKVWFGKSEISDQWRPVHYCKWSLLSGLFSSFLSYS